MEDSCGLVAFEVDGSSVRVRDTLHEEALTLHAGRDVDPQPALTDLFVAPVDAAVSFRTDGLRVGAHTGAIVRDGAGEHIGGFSEDWVDHPRGTYVVDVSGPVKLYVRIPDTELSGGYETTEHAGGRLHLDFDGTRTVTVGARSLHERPEARITVPDDPTALAEAFSYLGSSIKEFSPERSWPTLRGYPPAIRRGDELRIPDALSKPQNGVTVRVPATYAALYEVAPLAFYLGADIETGERPELRLENGYVEPLETPTERLAERADALLGRVLLLDSLVRVGGYFSNVRHVYDDIAGDLPFYPPELYDASLSAQLMEYLEVSPSLLDPHVPERPLRATLRDDPADAELIPHLLNDLASVSVDRGGERSAAGAGGGSTARDALAVGRTNRPVSSGETLLVPGAYEAGLDRSPREVPDGEVLFVADGEHAAEWRRVRNAVTAELDPPVSTGDLLVDPTREALAAALGDGYDFVCCLLPAVDGGVACADGVLSPDEVDAVDAWGLLLAGPGAPDVSAALCDRGVVTALATADRPTPTIARRLLRCLVRGHGFAEAARFVGDREIGDHWIVGAQPRPVFRREGGSVPIRVSVESEAPDSYRVSVWAHFVRENRIGSVTALYDDVTPDAFQLTGSDVTQPVPCSAEKVVELLRDPDYIVRLDGEPYHGEPEPTSEFVRESARNRLDDEARR
ncbi:hypothetical protein [Haloparvum sedimenti]|uniref:hypothetical protein n=1 Tax=Haloparvum sedimenti TaxID=1678448 RepID=UPI00071E77FD|nr:hypothetical protein [Haloparvum sedimenti]